MLFYRCKITKKASLHDFYKFIFKKKTKHTIKKLFCKIQKIKNETKETKNCNKMYWSKRRNQYPLLYTAVAITKGIENFIFKLESPKHFQALVTKLILCCRI